MNFLKLHARFLVALVLLMGLVGFGYSQVNEMADNVARKQTSLTSSLKTHYKRIFDDAKSAGGNPANVQGLVLGEKTQRVQELEERRNSLLTFRPDPAFTLAAVKGGPEGVSDADKVNYFYAVRLDLKKKLVRARYFKPDLDADNALGFSTPKEGVKAEQVAEFLFKMDMAREVARCVERSGTQVLESLKFEDARGIELLAQRGLPVQKVQSEAPYLEARTLNFNVRGTERAIYNLLIELQRPVKGDLRERYLAVENFTLSKPDLLDPADDLVSASFMVVAYRVNKDGAVPGGKRQAETTTTAPVSGGGRYR